MSGRADVATRPSRGAGADRAAVGAGGRLGLRAAAARQFGICRHPACSRSLIAAALFALFLLAIGKSPVDFVVLCLARRLRHRVLVPEHAAALVAADPDRARGRDPRAHRPHHDRRRGRAGARRLRRRGARHSDGRRRAAARRRCRHDGDRGDDRRRASGSASPAILRYARGVNETISSLLLTYIGIAIMNFFVEGRAARSLQPQQALDQADRRRLHGRQHPRHRRALGLRGRRAAVHRPLLPDERARPSASPRGSPAAISAPRSRRACRSASSSSPAR